MLGSVVSSGRGRTGGLSSGGDAVRALPLVNIFWDYSALTAPRCVTRGTCGLGRGLSAGRQLLWWPVGLCEPPVLDIGALGR